MSRKPNLFIVGAQKSGTTSLHEYLGAHPELFMCSPKEPSYFVSPAFLKTSWRHMYDRGYWRSEEAYLSLFKDGETAKYRGESSAMYAGFPLVGDAAASIHEFQPDARLIYIMRDPLERTISSYWHSVRKNEDTRPMLRAIQSRPWYLCLSSYHQQIRQFLEYFPREQLFLATYEELRDRPKELVRRVFEWLDVDPGFVPDNLGEVFYQTPSRIEVDQNLLGLASFRRSALWKRLSPRVPRFLKRAVPKGLYTRSFAKEDQDPAETIAYLRPILLEQTGELAELTGMRFDEWTTLFGG